MCDMTYIYLCHVTLSFVRHDSIYVCNVTHSYVRHDSHLYVSRHAFTCTTRPICIWVTSCIHMCAVTQHNYVTSRIHLCDMTHIHMCHVTHLHVPHDSYVYVSRHPFICAPWLNIIMSRHAFICATWLIFLCVTSRIYMYDTTHTYMCHATHSYVRCDWTYVCHVTHSSARHDSYSYVSRHAFICAICFKFKCVTWLTHTCTIAEMVLLAHSHMGHDSH